MHLHTFYRYTHALAHGYPSHPPYKIQYESFFFSMSQLAWFYAATRTMYTQQVMSKCLNRSDCFRASPTCDRNEYKFFLVEMEKRAEKKHINYWMTSHEWHNKKINGKRKNLNPRDLIRLQYTEINNNQIETFLDRFKWFTFFIFHYIKCTTIQNFKTIEF